MAKRQQNFDSHDSRKFNEKGARLPATSKKSWCLNPKPHRSTQKLRLMYKTGLAVNTAIKLLI